MNTKKNWSPLLLLLFGNPKRRKEKQKTNTKERNVEFPRFPISKKKQKKKDNAASANGTCLHASDVKDALEALWLVGARETIQSAAIPTTNEKKRTTTRSAWFVSIFFVFVLFRFFLALDLGRFLGALLHRDEPKKTNKTKTKRKLDGPTQQKKTKERWPTPTTNSALLNHRIRISHAFFFFTQSDGSVLKTKAKKKERKKKKTFI